MLNGDYCFITVSFTTKTHYLMAMHLSYSFDKNQKRNKETKSKNHRCSFIFRLILTSCSRYLYHRIQHFLHMFILFFLLLSDFVLFSSQRIQLIAIWKLKFIYHSQTQFSNPSITNLFVHIANKLPMKWIKLFCLLYSWRKWNISFPVLGHSIFVCNCCCYMLHSQCNIDHHCFGWKRVKYEIVKESIYLLRKTIHKNHFMEFLLNFSSQLNANKRFLDLFYSFFLCLPQFMWTETEFVFLFF